MIIVACVLAVIAAVLAAGDPVFALRRLKTDTDGRRLLLPTWLHAHSDATPLRTRMIYGAVGGIAVMLVLGTGLVGWLVGVLLTAVVAIGLGLFEPASTRKRRQQVAIQLPQTLELLASCLSVGLPLRRAATMVAEAVGGPLGGLLLDVQRRLDVGQRESEAWRCLGQQINYDPLSSLARDLARSVDSGTAVAHTLLRHAEDARRERAAQLEANAKAVGVRSVLPTMLCFLPAFALIGIVPVLADAIVRMF